MPAPKPRRRASRHRAFGCHPPRGHHHRGVDIESKLESHREIRRLAAAGKAVLIISSDLSELFAVTDRIVDMREGRIVGQGETQAMPQEGSCRRQ